ncbi:hypothetical protein PIB30_073796 [Stylosanthes scabra]|uniref:RNase H type-1 domain-containing protein n=1 Tax=Stylosanthes scabra TaxID=79078 RepID=A0ABU6RPF0_9FABA|nr:hypothetical protein [Stylosanthes scabra]
MAKNSAREFIAIHNSLASYGCILRNSEGIFIKAGLIDCLDIYLLMVNIQEYHYAHQDIIGKISELLLKPWDVLFEHVNREANKAADWLAKTGARHIEWLEPSPSLAAVIPDDLV